MKTKHYRYWFPKLTNMWKNIHYYIPIHIVFTKPDGLFIIQILGFQDTVCTGTSLFKIEINFAQKEEYDIHFNLLFFIHYKIEMNTYDISDKFEPWNWRQ
jgi:hypothetical protein